MNKPTDIQLYNRVKNIARKKFERYPSAYASNWIVREYKKRGGKYTKNKVNHSNLNRWFDEKWIQVIPYLEKKKKIPCGASNKHTKACRPLYRVNKSTPLTISEVVDLHGKKKIIELAKRKNMNMKGRIYWKRGVFYE